jgi:hypothetical protein
MSNNNVFSALYRWAHSQGENFTTDAFATLLREMIKRDPGLASRFLGWLCFGCETCSYFGASTQVDTQWVDKLGRPDIRITDGFAVALVEVKTFSDLGPDQLQKYRKILGPKSAAKALVLLTAFGASVGDDEHLLDQWRRWNEVEKWLRDNCATDPVLDFLIEQFCSFLRETGMSFDRVDWQYVSGVRSLVDLVQMLFKACEQAKVALGRQPCVPAWGGGEPYIGLSTAHNQFWIYLLWNEPHLIRFAFNEAQPDVVKLGEDERTWTVAPDGRRWETILNLESEDVHFFALNAQHQVDRLEEFIEKTYAAATKCIAPDKTPPKPPQAPPQVP